MTYMKLMAYIGNTTDTFVTVNLEGHAVLRSVHVTGLTNVQLVQKQVPPTQTPSSPGIQVRVLIGMAGQQKLLGQQTQNLVYKVSIGSWCIHTVKETVTIAGWLNIDGSDSSSPRMTNFPTLCSQIHLAERPKQVLREDANERDQCNIHVH